MSVEAGSRAKTGGPRRGIRGWSTRDRNARAPAGAAVAAPCVVVIVYGRLGT